MSIPFLSVCSGIGAPELAFGRHGMHSVLCSEIEEFPRAVLEHRFAAEDARARRAGHGPALWGDFTALRIRHLRRLGIALPRALVGGTPCQSFSIAGKRESLDDPRGNLSLSFVRLAHALANAIAGARRRTFDDAPVFYAVWENVPGVLNTRDNAFGCFLGALVGGDAALVPPDAEWGPVCHFDRRSHNVHRTFGWQSCRWPSEGLVEGHRARAAWRVLDAQHFRVPQRRRRVFVVVGFGARADPAEVLLELDRMPWDFEAGGEAREDVAATLAGGARSRGGYSHDDIPMTAGALSASTGGADENDAEQGRLLAFGGNNTSGAIDVATCLSAHGGPSGRMDFESETFVAHTLRGEGFDASEDGTGRGTPIVPYTAALRGHSDYGDGLPCLRAEGGDVGGGSEAVIAFNARQDTDVYGDVAGSLDCGEPQAQAIAFDTTQITSPANGSNPEPGDPCHPLAASMHAPAIAFSSKDHGADASLIAPTLRAMGHDGSHANGGGQMAIAFQMSQSGLRESEVHATLDANMGSRRMNGTLGLFGVRRLMPHECARLQSFPDDHARIPWRGRSAEECPDGPQYRAYGNSMNVEVMAWIGRRLAAQMRRAGA